MMTASRDKLLSKLKELRTLTEECLTLLASETDSQPVQRPVTRAGQRSEPIDFGKPIRPFMKTYSKNLSGSKKFVLLLARLAKGDPERQIALAEIKKQWGQMTGILGMDFNLFFTGDAKDRDWVETESKGLYNLRPGWKEILQKSE
jgi:hypothetical protein